MGEQVGFTNCVLEKLCFTENTIFIVFSAKHSFSKAKMVCWKTENIWKIVGCFWTWQNGVLWVCFFWGFSVIVVCFWCVWHSSRSVKNACFFFFPICWAFCGGGLFLLILGLEGLGVFVFLVFVFVFVLLLFLFCLLCFVLLLDCFCFCFCFFCFLFLFFLVFVFFVLFFLEGLRVRWGGPKGHLTWP